MSLNQNLNKKIGDSQKENPKEENTTQNIPINNNQNQIINNNLNNNDNNNIINSNNDINLDKTQNTAIQTNINSEQQTINNINNYKEMPNMASIDLIKDNFCMWDLDNIFTVFKKNKGRFYIIYPILKSFICYDLIDEVIVTYIKNAHDCYIINLRHIYDNNLKKDIVMSISGEDNNIKLWDVETWECILNIERANKYGIMFSACFLYDNDIGSNYIVTSNCTGSEYIKIYDFNNNKIKEVPFHKENNDNSSDNNNDDNINNIDGNNINNNINNNDENNDNNDNDNNIGINDDEYNIDYDNNYNVNNINDNNIGNYINFINNNEDNIINNKIENDDNDKEEKKENYINENNEENNPNDGIDTNIEILENKIYNNIIENNINENYINNLINNNPKNDDNINLIISNNEYKYNNNIIIDELDKPHINYKEENDNTSNNNGKESNDENIKIINDDETTNENNNNFNDNDKEANKEDINNSNDNEKDSYNDNNNENNIQNTDQDIELEVEREQYENIYFVDTYYSQKDNFTYIIACCSQYVKSYNYNLNILHKKYLDKEMPKKIHSSSLITKRENTSQLIESSIDGYIRIWDFYEGILLKRIMVCGEGVKGLCLWDENLLCVGCDDKSIKIIDLNSGNIVKILFGHKLKICCIKNINHEKYGKCLISKGWGNDFIKLWFINEFE